MAPRLRHPRGIVMAVAALLTLHAVATTAELLVIPWHSRIGRTVATVELNVNIGDTVLWSWSDSGQHDVVQGVPFPEVEDEDAISAPTPTPLFSSGAPAVLSSFIWAVTNVAEGTEVPFYCTLHPWMRGVLKVAGGSTTADTGTAQTTPHLATTMATTEPAATTFSQELVPSPFVALRGFRINFVGGGSGPSLRFSSVNRVRSSFFTMRQGLDEGAAAFQQSCAVRCLATEDCLGLHVRTLQDNTGLLRCYGMLVLGSNSGYEETPGVDSVSFLRLPGSVPTPCEEVDLDDEVASTITEAPLTAAPLVHVVRWHTVVGNPAPAAYTRAAVGDVVRFEWDDGAPHNVISGYFGEANAGVLFHSGKLLASGDFEWTVTGVVGAVIPYFCEIHPWMYGEIVIVPPRPPSLPPALRRPWRLAGVLTHVGRARVNAAEATMHCASASATLPPASSVAAIAVAAASAYAHEIGHRLWLNAIWEDTEWRTFRGHRITDSVEALPLIATTDRPLCLVYRLGIVGGEKAGLAAADCETKQAYVCLPAEQAPEDDDDVGSGSGDGSGDDQDNDGSGSGNLEFLPSDLTDNANEPGTQDEDSGSGSGSGSETPGRADPLPTADPLDNVIGTLDDTEAKESAGCEQCQCRSNVFAWPAL